jgi:hypothetical protein
VELLVVGVVCVDIFSVFAKKNQLLRRHMGYNQQVRLNNFHHDDPTSVGKYKSHS